MTGSEVTDPELDPDEDTEDLAMESDAPPGIDRPWRQLHPSSLFINLLPQTWRTAKGIWPLLALIVVGGQGGAGIAGLDLSLVLAFFALSVSRTVVHFMTLRYRIEGGKLEIKSGLLNRRSRVLDPHRIQNMELVQNPLHKLTGLVELRIETAGDASTEGLLSALSSDEAQGLKEALERLARKRRGLVESDEETEASETLVSLGIPEILAYGLSQRRVGTVALLFAVGMEGLTLLDPYTTQQVAGELSSARIIGAIILAFAGTWFFSGGQSLLRHYGFKLTLRGETLVTTEGLLTRRRVEIPQGKVQLVRIDEPFLRRQMGYGTALIETAALGMADGRVRAAEGVVPMVEQEDLGALVQQVSPSTTVDPWSIPLNPAHPRALYRGIIASLIRATFLAVVIGGLMHPWGWLALLLLPLSIPAAWLDWKKQGWLVTEQSVISRRGYFTRRTWIIDRKKIQSVHMGDSPLMRWHGLVAVVVRVAGSQVQLPDIGLMAGHRVMADLAETWTERGEE
ncbi:MAG: putative membrane protein [Myxococcota bacterium]|jgi:putative membrane protein